MVLSEHRLPQRVELEAAPGKWMQFALIPSGRFIMGSPPDEEGRYDNECQHEVFISRAFYLGQTCVTQEQYEAVMGANPSYHKGAKYPVDTVNWDEVMEFCRRFSQRTGRRIGLPTEAQWEYACRAGTSTPFNTGKTLPRKMANCAWWLTYPGNRVDVSFFKSAVVGSFPPNSRGLYDLLRPFECHPPRSFPPNAWGLYDMHGNLWQSCSDWYGDYPATEVADPTGPKHGSLRVLRGGSWGTGPWSCRSAFRSGSVPRNRDVDFGFRVTVLTTGVD
jgi:formylglycine-generating enzyme required for sulfatase activity